MARTVRLLQGQGSQPGGGWREDSSTEPGEWREESTVRGEGILCDGRFLRLSVGVEGLQVCGSSEEQAPRSHTKWKVLRIILADLLV